MKPERLLKLLAGLFLLSSLTVACGVEDESDTDFFLLRKLSERRKAQKNSSDKMSVKFGFTSLSNSSDPEDNTTVDNITKVGIEPGGGFSPVTPVATNAPVSVTTALSQPTATPIGSQAVQPRDPFAGEATGSQGSISFSKIFDDEDEISVPQRLPAGRYKLTLDYLNKESEVIYSVDNCKGADNYGEIEVLPGVEEQSVNVCDKDGDVEKTVDIPLQP